MTKWRVVSFPVSSMWHCKLVRGWEVCWLVDGPAESPEGIFPRVTAIGVVVRDPEYVSLVGYHGGPLCSLDRSDSVFQVPQWHISGASGQDWIRRFSWCCQFGTGPAVGSTQCKVLLLRYLRRSLQRRACWLVAVLAVVAGRLRIGPDSRCWPSYWTDPVGGRAIIMVNVI
jgi:hypothetical protein